MFKQIYRDQKRALKSILFWACVLIGVALAIFDLYNNEVLYNMPVERMGMLTAFIHATGLSPNGVFQLCAPLLCTIPYALAFLDDIQTRHINNLLSRMKCSDYYISRAISTGIIGGLYFICVYILLLLICAVVSPTPSIRIILSPIIPFTYIYQKSLLGFIGIYTVHSFIFGFTFNLLTLGISSIILNKYIGLAIPFVLYHTALLLAWILPKAFVYDFVNYIPYESFNIQIYDLFTVVYRHGVILALGFALYAIGIYRHRVLCIDNAE